MSIEYRHITKSYGDRVILDDFNLYIPSGALLTIVGSSGSGKTTLMKLVNGLIQADTGEVLIDGVDVQQEDLIALRRRIGYVIQGNILFPHLTIAENISYVQQLLKVSEAEQKAWQQRSLALFHLDEAILSRYPHELSGGQQQRVGIARALAANPNIILMDEPFGAVDAITRYQLQKELKQLHQQTGVTIIFVTHDISEALKLGTHVLVIDQGEIQQFDTPQVVREFPANEFVATLVTLALE